MELTFNISNEPTYDIQRIVTLRKFEADFGVQEIKMICVVAPVIETRMARATEVILTASNRDFVNAQGEEVEAETEGAIGEYDFLMFYLDNPVILGNLFGAYVSKADLKGRFN